MLAQKILDLFGENGQHWCQYYMAQTIDGNRAVTTSSDADKWCLLGACRKLGVEDEELETLMSKVGVNNVPSFNDQNSWPVIKAKLVEIVELSAVNQDTCLIGGETH